MPQGQNTATVLGFLSNLFGSYADSSTKPGFKKSEFWLSAAAAGLSFVPAVGGPYGPIVAGVIALGYSALRTYVTSKADAGKSANIAQVVQALPAVDSEPPTPTAPSPASYLVKGPASPGRM